MESPDVQPTQAGLAAGPEVGPEQWVGGGAVMSRRPGVWGWVRTLVQGRVMGRQHRGAEGAPRDSGLAWECGDRYDTGGTELATGYPHGEGGWTVPFCHLPWPQREAGPGHDTAKAPTPPCPSCQHPAQRPCFGKHSCCMVSSSGHPCPGPRQQQLLGDRKDGAQRVFGVLVCPGMAMQVR